VTERVEALVIGGGPAGLMAAEALIGAGIPVLLAERMPTVGRKLLMAGKSGLNLTKAEPADAFRAAFAGHGDSLAAPLAAFGPEEVQAWAKGLGQDLFTGSTGRVFPVAMKASPLLRAWLARLTDGGLDGGLDGGPDGGLVIRTRWRWTGFEDESWGGVDNGEGHRIHKFETPDGPRRLGARVTVLAFGGASWSRLGSDGAWAAHLPGTAPFAPSNCGVTLEWSDRMADHMGAPVKAIALQAGDAVSRGEIVIARTGLEGGGLYPLIPALRQGAALRLDLFPDLTAEALSARLARRRRGESLVNRLRRSLGLEGTRRALAMEFGRPLPDDPGPLLKALPVPLTGLAPLDAAISTAGGLRFDRLDADLMLRDRPGVFAAGEMLDWDAPTGGYLLTASLATGRHAGRAAARRLSGG